MKGKSILFPRNIAFVQKTPLTNLVSKGTVDPVRT